VEGVLGKFVKRKWKYALNVAAVKLGGWGTSATKAGKAIPPRKEGGAWVARLEVYPAVTRRIEDAGSSDHGGAKGATFPRNARSFRASTQWTGRESLGRNMCPFCMGHTAGAECYGRGMEYKPACLASECGKKPNTKICISSS
jgi:hypothetical protein